MSAVLDAACSAAGAQLKATTPAVLDVEC
jgi:hypothetical protein